MNDRAEIVPSSFRDPSGFLFRRKGSLYRQVNHSYKEQYRKLMNSGLYEELVSEGLLLKHEEVNVDHPTPTRAQAYKVIKPEYLSFISYPYEWCFTQLKEAALTTLKIQKKAFDFGMVLKDASAYNIQFRGCNPVHIDTLSFEKYQEGEPWVAYRQFCRHFLAPLAIMAYIDAKLNRLSRIFIDGIPLELASSLLPWNSRFRFTLLSHIHLHARSQSHFADQNSSPEAAHQTEREMNTTSFRGLIDSLESAISNLSWKSKDTLWSNYYGGSSNYSSQALEHKQEVVSQFLDEKDPVEVWDLGANVGLFSWISAEKGARTISFDLDPACVETNYLKSRENSQLNILPLVLDLTNPSPGIGWKNEERLSLKERGPADTALALALIHHLAISNNTPFTKIASFLAELCNSLIVEFVPKKDPQAQKLLASREDVFSDYTRENFETAFKDYFCISGQEKLRDSDRSIYLMEKS
ncbi:MAG: SAM-dependent methyltransferase [Candidatus Acetothermia bacterium]